MTALEEVICERCHEPILEQYCTHRDLCEACLHMCHDCMVEFAESIAYDDERDS